SQESSIAEPKLHHIGVSLNKKKTVNTNTKKTSRFYLTGHGFDALTTVSMGRDWQVVQHWDKLHPHLLFVKATYLGNHHDRQTGEVTVTVTNSGGTDELQMRVGEDFDDDIP